MKQSFCFTIKIDTFDRGYLKYISWFLKQVFIYITVQEVELIIESVKGVLLRCVCV
jgi:hypothetical protein